MEATARLHVSAGILTTFISVTYAEGSVKFRVLDLACVLRKLFFLGIDLLVIVVVPLRPCD